MMEVKTFFVDDRDATELAPPEVFRGPGLELVDLWLVDDLVEDDNERIRVHLFNLERSKPEVRISVMLISALQLGVVLRIPVRDGPVLAEEVEVVPGHWEWRARVEQWAERFEAHIMSSFMVIE